LRKIGDSHAKNNLPNRCDDACRPDNGSETAKQIILMKPEDMINGKLHLMMADITLY